MDDNKEATRGGDWKSGFPWAIVGALIFFVFLWRWDFPKPMVDDLFFNGASLNLAAGGDYSNPLIIRQQFPSHYFFEQPPFHPYAVYPWLYLFGISANSLLAFQNLMYFVISAAMILILRRLEARAFVSWLAPLGVTAIFLKSGLRPEAFAVAETMAGYALFLYHGKKPTGLFFSILLVVLGCGSAPRTGIFSLAFLTIMAWQYVVPAPDKPAKAWRFCAVAGMAGGGALLLFLLLIHFRLADFLHTFLFHASKRLDKDKLTLFRTFVLQTGWRCVPAGLLALLLLMVSFRRPVGTAKEVSIGMLVAFLLAAWAGVLGWGTGWYPMAALFFMAGAMSRYLLRWRLMLLNLALTGVLLVANCSFAVEVFGLASGKISNVPPENSNVLRAMRSTPDQTLVIDGWAARYVFDYKLPPGCIDFDFGAPFPLIYITDVPLRQEDLFMIGPIRANKFYSELHREFHLEEWCLWNVNNWREPKYLRQIFMIRAKDGAELMRTHSHQ